MRGRWSVRNLSCAGGLALRAFSLRSGPEFTVRRLSFLLFAVLMSPTVSPGSTGRELDGLWLVEVSGERRGCGVESSFYVLVENGRVRAAARESRELKAERPPSQDGLLAALTLALRVVMGCPRVTRASILVPTRAAIQAISSGPRGDPLAQLFYDQLASITHRA